ncbi:MAG: RNA-binding protein [Elusimicrobiota bacterium]
MGMKLFVGNLSFTTTDAELKEAFAKAGTVTSASVIKDKYTDKSRGFAFVEMSTEEEAKKAIEIVNGTEIGGRKINVAEARPPRERSEGGGGRGFGGGDRPPRRDRF